MNSTCKFDIMIMLPVLLTITAVVGVIVCVAALIDVERLEARVKVLETQVASYDTVTSKTLPITWQLITKERGVK